MEVEVEVEVEMVVPLSMAVLSTLDNLLTIFSLGGFSNAGNLSSSLGTKRSVPEKDLMCCMSSEFIGWKALAKLEVDMLLLCTNEPRRIFLEDISSPLLKRDDLKLMII